MILFSYIMRITILSYHSWKDLLFKSKGLEWQKSQNNPIGANRGIHSNNPAVMI